MILSRCFYGAVGLTALALHAIPENGSLMVVNQSAQNDITPSSTMEVPNQDCDRSCLKRPRDWHEAGLTVGREQSVSPKRKKVDSRLKEVREDLIAAIYEADADCVQLILEKYPEVVDMRDFMDFTPLHEAVSEKSIPIIKLLIEYNADVNAQDIDGDAPLHYAGGDHNIIAELLRVRSIKPMLMNHDGTPAIAGLLCGDV